MILVLMGPPGVGKGTQGARIAVHFDLPAISTGALFREEIANGTPLGIALKRYNVERGEYVPDEVVIRVVRERIMRPDCARGLLLDGFPRTEPQAEALDAMLDGLGRLVTAVLDFEAPIQVLVERFSGRRICPVDGSTYHIVNHPPVQPGLCDICSTQLVMRADDAPDVVERRLVIYKEKTEPLIGYYRRRGTLIVIDAVAEEETVFAHVIEALAQRRRAQWRAVS